MNLIDIRRMPFMRWDLPFYHDESFHSWFARTVGLNGDETVAHFNMSHDMSSSSLKIEKALELTRRLPLPEQTLSRMERSAPIRTALGFSYCGQHFRHSDLSFKTPRWCPACIAEQPYRRAWFDILPLTRCPYHDEKLVSRDGQGNEVPWDATDFSCNVDGTALGTSGGKRGLRRGSFGHYVLGRLGFEELLRSPFLDQFQLMDVLPACDALGREVAKGQDDGRPLADLGFELAKDTHAELAEALRTIVRKTEGLHEKIPIRECFGRSYLRSVQSLGSSMKTAVVRAMEEAITAEAHAKPTITGRDVRSRRVTAQEVADRHSIDASTVAIIARYLGLHRGKKRKPLIQDDVMTIVEFVGNLVNRQAAAKHLNISEHAIQALIAEGYVTRFNKLRRGEFLGQRFHIPELDALLVKLDELPQTGNILLSKPFHAFTLAKKGLQHGELAVKVLKGEVKVAGRKPDVHGFKSLVIETGRLNKRPRVTADPNWLSLAHVQALLNFRKETICELMKLGLLKPQGDYVRLFAFRREEVETIQNKYARSTDLCGGLGVTKYRFRDMMDEVGVCPLIRSDTRSFVDTIYDKTTVMKALGLQNDPTVGTDPQLLKFWAVLQATAKDRFPALLFSDRPMAGGQTVGKTTRLSVLPITYDLASRTVQAIVAPAKLGPVFTFDLDADDWSADFTRLFTALRERDEMFLKNQSDYHKERRRQARELRQRR